MRNRDSKAFILLDRKNTSYNFKKYVTKPLRTHILNYQEKSFALIEKG